MFIHGTRSSASVWDRQVAALGRRGIVASAVDLPGHGERSDETFSLDGAIAAIRDAVAASPAPPVLVGHSLGGYAALAYAGGHEDRIAGLVLSGCATQLRPWVMATYRHASHHITRALRLGGGTWNVVTDMLTSMAAYSPLPDLRRLTVPMWLVSGRWDVLRFDERRYLAARTWVGHQVFARAGHDIHVEMPGRYTRFVMEALAALPSLRGAVPATA
ncbi:alpha/beta hydrolase [Serinibacter arcticus]|uniref:Alpha/beta hydrolase n=1 Tax=Serinibacter arcticus TaxID=1655435 RepID=A0A2U1ZZW7_9MICO|nr:alpha/beta hydrolase [Serinibacter arcticus]